MNRTMPLAILGVLFIAADIVNLFLLPGEHLVSSLYAIPVLIAGHRMQPRGVAIVLAIAIGLYLKSAFLEQRPLIVWLFSVLGLLIVGYLTLQLSAQRREIAQQAAKLQDAHRHLQEFLGMVSHDLAGALTGVLGCAELLTRSEGRERSEVTRWAAEAIDTAAGQMRRLLDDLRDAARVGAGHFTAAPNRMDLVALTRQVVAQQQANAHGRRIILQSGQQLEGRWDRERIAQLLTNLLSNAVKYSPDGEDIHVALEGDGDEVVISVRDRGPGLTQEEQQLLFQPFIRLDRDRRMAGTGLGLCIAKAIAEAHGGRIWVESEEGRGSTFYVALPGPGHSAVCPDVLEEHEQEPGEAAGTSPVASVATWPSSTPPPP